MLLGLFMFVAHGIFVEFSLVGTWGRDPNLQGIFPLVHTSLFCTPLTHWMFSHWRDQGVSLTKLQETPLI